MSDADRAPLLRIGHGIDAHRLEEGRPLWLGGVTVPYPRGLVGHSDGDVAAHALASALLGAAGLGDLGRYFPSSEAAFAGLSGADLLGEVGQRVAAAGWRTASAQVVIVAEDPRLGRHLEPMSAVLSAAIGGPPGCVTVGVTSTDGLGATGRGEGIAASAVSLLIPL